MNTPTHALINWTAAKAIPGIRLPKSAVLLGSIAPDIPLYVLSISGALWFKYVAGWETTRIARHMFSELFYHDPIWISLHNMLHSPLVLVFALMLLQVYWRGQAMLERWWPVFLLSCLLHTAVDIPVHHDDGPLIFWPLNWTYRFSSPLSYWDPRHYGREVMVFEGCLFLFLVGLNVVNGLRRRSNRQKLDRESSPLTD